MKKILALLLAAVICLSLVACGGDAGATNGNDKPRSVTDADLVGEGDDTKSAEKLVLNSENDKTQSVTDAELVGEWYEVKSANRLVLHGDGSLKYKAQPGDWKLSNGVIDVSNIYIDCKLTVVFEKGSLSLQNDELTFMQWSDLPKNKLSVGDGGQKENIKITLTNVSFSTETPDAILNSAFRQHVEEFVPQDGMTYAKVSVDIANMSKREINIPGFPMMLDVILDYNDGFLYATHDNQTSFFVTDTDYKICYGNETAKGYDISIQPLQEKSIDIYIPCPELIANDDSAPLTVGIISRYGTEIYYCEYFIR